MTVGTPPPAGELELEDYLSRPTRALTTALAQLGGDIVVLGAGGKMGPSLARMARRAAPNQRIFAVSRWSNEPVANALRADDIECISADLLDAARLGTLPEADNVIFMAGQKFGTTGSPATTWAMNAAVPAFVGERYAGTRTVVFSTGNVYALSPVGNGGSSEDDEPSPVGEYAYSCLARERIFASTCERHASPIAVVRLNYAHDLRYGVLTDLAARIVRREPIDLRMGYVNVIWQGDANRIALASLAHASSPHPFIINVAGPQTLRVQDLARALGVRLGIDPAFVGAESRDALLSSSARMQSLFADPLLAVDVLMDWVADWILRGGRLLNKPTSFERRDGRF